MIRKNFYLFSLKYAPGLYKEFSLLNKLFNKYGFRAVNLISNGYYKQSESDDTSFLILNGIGNKGMLIDLLLFPLILYRVYKNIKKGSEKNIFLFYNPHPINFFVQSLLIFIPNSEVVTVLHEPYKTVKDRMAYGLKGFVFFSIVNFFQYLSLLLSDKVVVMSPYGRNVFLKYFYKYKDKLIDANLLMENNQMDITPLEKRKYFSYVGTVNKGKGIDDFIKVVNYVLKTGIKDVKFLIITPSNIKKYLLMLHTGYEEVLSVINKSDISDSEIDYVIKHSKGVLILHQTASQSGVLPLCCKFGTPVIARNITAFSQFIDRKGILIGEHFNPLELTESCRIAEKNFSQLSKESLFIFENNFSEDNFDKFYMELLR